MSQVLIPSSTKVLIEKHAEKLGVDHGEVLRRAMWLFDHAVKGVEAGGELRLDRVDGRTENLIPTTATTEA
jgi:hypothetical protein